MPQQPAKAADPRAAVIVCLDFGDARGPQGRVHNGYEESVEEAVRLVQSAGVERFQVVKGKRAKPDARLFAGSGKALEVERAADELNAAYVVFNHELSPAQQRNLEKELKRRVFDRTELILEIFAQRAQTSEGKLQVELARLQHQSTRLVRGWTHLERQRGGLGKTGGPGEKQIELDRRYIARRVKVLKEKIHSMVKQRHVQRHGRARRNVLSVSIVGYTNAGKSSLFNALTRSRAYEADRLFATLDTTTRRLWIEGAGEVVLSDTVGFIRELPHTLVAAFRATLEETVRADLLLHVVDAASPARAAQRVEVNKVLAEIGAQAVPQIEVWNKIDLTGLEPRVERGPYGNGRITRAFVSARSGAGLDELRAGIAEFARWRAGERGAVAENTFLHSH